MTRRSFVSASLAAAAALGISDSVFRVDNRLAFADEVADARMWDLCSMLSVAI